MANTTSIEWTDLSWNPVHGCSKVSPGCAHCYAETLSRRYKQTLKPWTPSNAAENVILKPHKLWEPLSGGKQWREPKLVFVNSTSDLFHEEVPDGFIGAVLAVIASVPRHTFQVLTKRPARMAKFMRHWYGTNHAHADGTISSPRALENLWLGVWIENRRFVHRADLLRETPAAVRFVSAEPLLGPLVHDTDIGMYNDCSCGGQCEHHKRDGDIYTSCWSDAYEGPELDLEDIDWLIVGGESGSGYRPMREEWVRDLRDAFAGVGVCFFFKQWGGNTAKAGGRLLDGRTWDEMPAGAGLSVHRVLNDGSAITRLDHRLRVLRDNAESIARHAGKLLQEGSESSSPNGSEAETPTDQT